MTEKEQGAAGDGAPLLKGRTEQSLSSIATQAVKPAGRARYRFWRADGSTDVTTNGTATANGGGAEQARKRRRSFARAFTATEFADKRAGKLTLATYRGGRS